MMTSLVLVQDQKRIKDFVDLFIRVGVTMAPGVPDDMADGPADESGWTPWKPVDSPIGEREIIELEDFVGGQLPSLFRGYLMYKCLLMTDFGFIRLPEIPSNEPLRDVVQFFTLLKRDPYCREHRYLPFAEDGNDGGPICFDLKAPTPSHDYPVVFVDRDRARYPGYVGVVRWPSFAALLDAIQESMLPHDRGDNRSSR